MTAQRRRLPIVVGVTGLIVLLAAGCGGSADQAGDSGGDSAAVSEDRAAGGGAPEKNAAAPGAAADQADPADPAAGTPADLRVGTRAIIYTGSITVRVDDVDAAAARATGIVAGAGGFVGGDRRSSDSDDAEASLELRVPADRFGAVVDQLAGLGRPERREISTEDVTEQTLDLDARIATQQARVASGRRLLAQAKSLNDLVLLEGELAKREADLASLEAKKRRLADLTALSTITVVLLGPTAEGSDDEPETGFLAGLRAGWRAFVASVGVLLTVLGALLPWLIAVGLPVTALGWLVRRLRRRPVIADRTPAPAPAGTAAAYRPGPVPSPAGGTPAGTPAGAAAPAPAPASAPAPAPRDGGS